MDAKDGDRCAHGVSVALETWLGSPDAAVGSSTTASRSHTYIADRLLTLDEEPLASLAQAEAVA